MTAFHIRELKERPYRLIYRVSDRVDVLAVMHYRQLLPGDVEALDQEENSAKTP